MKRTVVEKVIFFTLLCWSAGFVRVDAGAGAAPEKSRLSLPVVEIVERYPPYADFCQRQPDECDLSGEALLIYSPGLIQKLREINFSVNSEIRFSLDTNQYGVEDHWALPTDGFGDCEDFALEKRARLARSGVARGALRLAFVLHKRYLSSHCVLTVETTQGTYILDSYFDEVLRWDHGIYNFEARERTDGRWDRFDQMEWTYEY